MKKADHIIQQAALREFLNFDLGITLGTAINAYQQAHPDTVLTWDFTLRGQCAGRRLPVQRIGVTPDGRKQEAAIREAKGR